MTAVSEASKSNEQKPTTPVEGKVQTPMPHEGAQKSAHVEAARLPFRWVNHSFASFVNFARTERKRPLAEMTCPPRLLYGGVSVVLEFVMAPRAYWKGYLKLSLVSCPIALFPATSEREKISFHQLNKNTGHRIKYRKVDAESGDEVESTDIIKGYEVGKGEYIELDPEELEAVAIESKRVIDIDEFVPREEIDELYLNSPYYIAPDGEVGQQAFAVIREAIRKEGMVAIGKVVFTSREHIIALEARGKGLLGVTLRYPYEVRNEAEYFDDIPDEKIPKDMLELASHIVKTKAGHFGPSKFDDRYEDALKDLLRKKQEGKPIERPERREPAKVINLMEALRKSVEASGASGKAKSRQPATRGQSEQPKRKKARRAS
jgi:DNA end-binding protein Ku